SAAALAGFSGAWALFHWVLPKASSTRPTDVADAARQVDLPVGELPNGSGLDFAPVGSSEAGTNLRAAMVIWEWTQVKHRQVVWPPAYATAPVRAMAITP